MFHVPAAPALMQPQFSARARSSGAASSSGRAVLSLKGPCISPLPLGRQSLRCNALQRQQQRDLVYASAAASWKPQVLGLPGMVSARMGQSTMIPHGHVRINGLGRRKLTILSAGAAGGMGGHGGGAGRKVEGFWPSLLVGAAITYIALIVLIPFANVFVQAFGNGVHAFAEHLLDPDFLHAVKLTLMLAAVAVPINVLFGLVAAINITRNEFPGKVFFLSLLDLPFSISPVVTGLMLTLLYGRNGWFGPLLQQAGINLVFAFGGMALATMFVTLPFVVRELIPILETMDLSQEEAARTLGANDWQVFWNVTLPNIRWGLLYGTILTNARAMGEFGAVSVISGNILGKTQTLTLFVESAYKEYNTEAAFAAAVLLSSLALFTLFIKDKVEQAAAAEARK